MKAYIFIIVALYCGLTVFSQENYLNTQFAKDKKVLEKEAYKDLKKCTFYKEQDSLRIVFIYCVSDIDSVGFEINNNKYLDKIEPCYLHYNHVFSRKFPTKKRLKYDGYVLSKNDSIIALYGTTYPYKFRPYTHSEKYDKEYEDLVKNVLIQNFDFCFYTSPNGLNFIWCVKGNETFIYKIETGEMKSLQECYAQDLDILTISDILRKEVDKSIEKYFIRFR
jgi:hypothetical protein